MQLDLFKNEFRLTWRIGGSIRIVLLVDRRRRIGWWIGRRRRWSYAQVFAERRTVPVGPAGLVGLILVNGDNGCEPYGSHVKTEKEVKAGAQTATDERNHRRLLTPCPAAG